MDYNKSNVNKEKNIEILRLIKKELYKYDKKYININEGSVYFIIDEILYGYSVLKNENLENIPFVWLENSDYQIKSSDGPDILYKGYTQSYMLLEYEDMLELYTLINMENKLLK